MTEKIDYVQLYSCDQKRCAVFESLMADYVRELDEHGHEPMPEGFLKKWVGSIISMQGPKDRHLELCYLGKEPIGFLYGKVDRDGHNGYIRPGWGYIMEFYVIPSRRRKGCGREMYKRLEKLFKDDGADKMYLTADPVTGKPFWEAMGFSATGERSPENKMEIYEKTSSLDWGKIKLMPLTEKTAEEIGGWKYESPYDVYSFRGEADGWLMDRSTWGREQFCLADGGRVIGQVSCQKDGDDLWVGWAMAPELCGKGHGAEFVKRCVSQLRYVTGHDGRIMLRVSARNQRAVRAYQKAGFKYAETIRDEIAYSGRIEDFLVMELKDGAEK